MGSMQVLGNLGQEITQTSGEEVADTIIVADGGDSDIVLPVLDEEIPGRHVVCYAPRSTHIILGQACILTSCLRHFLPAWVRASDNVYELSYDKNGLKSKHRKR